MSCCECIYLIDCDKNYENDFEEIHFDDFRWNDLDFGERFFHFSNLYSSINLTSATSERERHPGAKTTATKMFGGWKLRPKK